MITTFVTATILAAALAGAPQIPVTHPCRKAADGWVRLLFDTDLPDDTRRWLGGGCRPATAAACHPGGRDPEATPGVAAGAVPATAPLSGESGPHPIPAPYAPAFSTPHPIPASVPTPTSAPTTLGSSIPAAPGSSDPDPWGPGPSAPPKPSRPSGPSGRPSGDSSQVRPPAVLPTPETGEIGESDEVGGVVERDGADHVDRVDALSRHLGTLSPGRISPGRAAVSAALRQVGTPYVWGGGSSTGPTGGGFDCSGLVLHAWSRAGATLTHYTGSQFRQGRRVSFARLRPGDLVFFGGGAGDPTHVGLYVRDGVMVHAPKTGDVVKTTNFAASVYYRARYRGAVRPQPSPLFG
ncbi:NlpC/P60 family protein [Streptosporangium sp. NPDC051022]|uniref:C40 family peptidase n=1 Tax=Streptosporangium sp. NPDC051022 TaxID=3155752 RepID=UPI0034173A98